MLWTPARLTSIEVAGVLFNRWLLCTVLSLERSQAIGRSALMDAIGGAIARHPQDALGQRGRGTGNWTRRAASSSLGRLEQVMCEAHEGYVEAGWKMGRRSAKPISGAAMQRTGAGSRRGNASYTAASLVGSGSELSGCDLRLRGHRPVANSRWRCWPHVVLKS